MNSAFKFQSEIEVEFNEGKNNLYLLKVNLKYFRKSKSTQNSQKWFTRLGSI